MLRFTVYKIKSCFYLFKHYYKPYFDMMQLVFITVVYNVSNMTVTLIYFQLNVSSLLKASNVFTKLLMTM